jgi:hypothetical protein
MDYKFSSPVGTYFPLMKLIANNKETFQIRRYVALVQEADAIFLSELPTSQAVTEVYIMVASKYSKL